MPCHGLKSLNVWFRGWGSPPPHIAEHIDWMVLKVKNGRSWTKWKVNVVIWCSGLTGNYREEAVVERGGGSLHSVINHMEGHSWMQAAPPIWRTVTSLPGNQLYRHVTSALFGELSYPYTSHLVPSWQILHMAPQCHLLSLLLVSTRQQWGIGATRTRCCRQKWKQREKYRNI